MDQFHTYSYPDYGVFHFGIRHNNHLAVAKEIASAFLFDKMEDALPYCRNVSLIDVCWEKGSGSTVAGSLHTPCISEPDIFELYVEAIQRTNDSRVKARLYFLERWIQTEVLPDLYQRHGLSNPYEENRKINDARLIRLFCEIDPIVTETNGYVNLGSERAFVDQYCALLPEDVRNLVTEAIARTNHAVHESYTDSCVGELGFDCVLLQDLQEYLEEKGHAEVLKDVARGIL